MNKTTLSCPAIEGNIRLAGDQGAGTVGPSLAEICHPDRDLCTGLIELEYREEATKGSIEPGKPADLVVLDRNPQSVDPDAIEDTRVIGTIKEGRTIYRRESMR